MSDRRASPSHYVAVAILRDDTFVGVTSVGMDLAREPGSLEDVERLGSHMTARQHEDGSLRRDYRFKVLSWQRFS